MVSSGRVQPARCDAPRYRGASGFSASAERKDGLARVRSAPTDQSRKIYRELRNKLFGALFRSSHLTKKNGASHMMDVAQLFKRDHAKASDLFEKLSDTSDQAVKARERLFAIENWVGLATAWELQAKLRETLGGGDRMRQDLHEAMIFYEKQGMTAKVTELRARAGGHRVV